MPLSGFTFASASGWAYGGVEGGYTYLLPGSMVKVASSLTYFMIATTNKMPRVHLRYWVLASLLAETLGAVMLFVSTFATWPSLSMLHTATLARSSSQGSFIAGMPIRKGNMWCDNPQVQGITAVQFDKY